MKGISQKFLFQAVVVIENSKKKGNRVKLKVSKLILYRPVPKETQTGQTLTESKILDIQIHKTV